MSRRTSLRWALLAAALYWMTAPGAARAHDPFELTTSAVVSTDALVLLVTMRPAVAARLRGPGELDQRALESVATGLFRVTSSSEALTPKSVRVATNADSELELRIHLPPPGAGPLRLDAVHLRSLPEGYLNHLTATLNAAGESPQRSEKFLSREDSALELTWEPKTSASQEPWHASAWRFLRLGGLHVLTGYDHLLFLAGVLLPCRRPRTLWLLVSCFTVAHAMTLGAALLGGWNAPSRIVEPLIAASIVVVGLENLWVPDPHRARYFVTFAFGLLHGLGFASALRAHELGPMTWLPLAAFNLGVELSQLVVASVLLPALWLLRARRVGPWVLSALYAGVALMGAYWLVQRLAAG